MTAAHLLLDLGRIGVRLEADGERLRYAPRRAVTPGLLIRLKAHKPDLLALLSLDKVRRAAARPRAAAPDDGLPAGYLDPARPRLNRLDMPRLPPWCKGGDAVTTGTYLDTARSALKRHNPQPWQMADVSSLLDADGKSITKAIEGNVFKWMSPAAQKSMRADDENWYNSLEKPTE